MIIRSVNLKNGHLNTRNQLHHPKINVFFLTIVIISVLAAMGRQPNERWLHTSYQGH